MNKSIWRNITNRLGCRYHHDIRVRFAPSPTGALHLGGLRTALYNYFFAKSLKGQFLLRIEDTDQTRLVPGAVQSIIDDLLWCGIQIDEGPGFGGNFGSYIQSERKHFYIDAVQNLLDNGTAYRCFCTERRLELLRKEAARTRQVPRYDNKCRYLTPEQVTEKLQENTTFCIRFLLKERSEPIDDFIYGKVFHNVAENEGDPVIMKSDQFPTYHLANVVDDHMMNISHVLRGVEWQISTVKHLLLYEAFGWKPPRYGHLPLLLNADGTKLSKRQGDLGVRTFREKGYFPNALVNYVMSAGGGFHRETSQKIKLRTISELSEKFDIENLNSHPSKLNPNLLNEFNRLAIIRSLSDKQESQKLVKIVQSLIQATYSNEKNLDLNSNHILRVVEWSSSRLNSLHDLTSKQLSFLWIKPEKFDSNDVTKDQLKKLLKQLYIIEFSKDSLLKALKQFSTDENINFPKFMKYLRSALSGLKEGPGVAEMMEILGKDVSINRIEGNFIESSQAELNTKVEQ